MKGLIADCSRGQMKIQQMAFMLVGLVVFFAMVGILVVVFSLAGLKDSANTLRENEARELAKKLASSPELAFTSSSDCNSCVDLEKSLMLADLNKQFGTYNKFWNLGYLQIEIVYPEKPKVECTRFNFPECDKISVLDDGGSVNAKSAFIALAYWDRELGKYQYEMGKIHASAKKIE